MRVFLLLQTAVLLVNILLAFAFPEWDHDLALHRFHHVKYMITNIIVTTIYFLVIWRFVYSLENGIYVVHKKRRRKCSGSRAIADSCRYATPSRPSAPWSSSSSSHTHGATSSNLPPRRDEVNEQTLPLKEMPSEPQPCSSKYPN